MTLLDASVIIDGLRAKDLRLLEQMRSVDGAVCGVTRTEILGGARGAADRQKLVTILDGFARVLIADSLWDDVGDTQAALRSSGVTVPLADALLSTLAMSLGVDIWARDAHFQVIQQAMPSLKLFGEAT